MDNTNTILLTESGDLEVYEGKEPKMPKAYPKKDRLSVHANYIICTNHWLSTKKIVKMAEGERDKLVSHISKGSIISAFKLTYPIDVSDIVTLRKVGSKDDLEGELFGYFTSPPVDKEEEMLEDLIGWAEIKSIEEGLDGSVYQSHFEDGFISAVKYVFQNYTLKRR